MRRRTVVLRISQYSTVSLSRIHQSIRSTLTNVDARSAFIHTIVRAAILITALQCRSRERAPDSTQDLTPDSPQGSIPDEEPPSYPTSDAGLRAYPDAETFRLDEQAGIGQKKAQNTSVASSSTLTASVDASLIQ